MKKFVVLFFFTLVLLFLIFFRENQPTATINGHTFIIEIAKTTQAQEVGLAKYNSLPTNKGMYFPFPHPGMYQFWMKDMQFPIDIIFIQNDKITDIFSSVPSPEKGQTLLPTYGPSSPINAVLEINAGLSQKYGFKKGDKIKLTE